jgi:glycosyltransferase involved in cell wall biosynthesis
MHPDAATGKPTLLVVTSTFPRWENDTIPPFVYELSRRLTSVFEVHVLAPAYPAAKTRELMGPVHVHRFHYFFKRYETLAGGDGILPALRKNKAFFLLIPFFIIGEYIALRRLVRSIRPTVIHAHWILPQGLTAWLLHCTHATDYIVTCHGADIFALQGCLLRWLKRTILKRAKTITAVSRAVKNEINRALCPDLSVEIMPMGVDGSLFNPGRRDEALRERYNITGPFLLFVGRLAEKKGVGYLIAAMPKILDRHPNTTLMITGAGPLLSALRHQAEELSVSNHIIFTGAVPNRELPAYYATADIFIGPSISASDGDTEGFGLTFVEAGMSGAWLIGSDVGGVSDIIQPGINGTLITEKDAHAIADAVTARLSLHTAHARHAAIDSFQHFDWEIVAERYAGILGAPHEIV